VSLPFGGWLLLQLKESKYQDCVKGGNMDSTTYKPSEQFAKAAWIKSFSEYEEKYQQSIEQPEAFWQQIARDDFYWHKPFTKVCDYNYDLQKGPIQIEWFRDGQTNISYNCLDRHLEKNASKVALIWEGNEPNETKQLTYRELHQQVCKFANVLKKMGVKRGDRVAVYMPMTAEIVVTVLACARIGAVHSVIFGGFSAESLADRILDAKCETLVTADGCFRGKKLIPIKEIANEAMDICERKENFKVKSCISFARLGREKASRP
jgi:acetyl-CoA synthetase